MAFGKKETLVGLDIGSRTLKVAEISESKRGRELKRFGLTEIPARRHRRRNHQRSGVGRRVDSSAF